jgi:phospholipase C
MAAPSQRLRLPAVRPDRGVELTLANEGHEDITYTLTPNDYEGRTNTVVVKHHRRRTVPWPTNRDGYYDVVVSADTADGFRRRYAGRVA